AAFWPFAEFSPEWVAIRWALAHDVPVRFIDLPAAHTLALTADDPDPSWDAVPGEPAHRADADGADGAAVLSVEGAGAGAAPAVDP
ncbi:hypothetical protein EWI31_33055, partial [Streptomyces tsukubensis]